jgi:hypothetical protein
MVLVTGPKVPGFNSAEDSGFLRAMKTRSMIFFGEKPKHSVLNRMILLHVKDPCEVKQRYFAGKR